MESTDDEVKQRQLIDARARNISHNVRCTECGSQSIEDSQADIAILLRKLIRDEIRAGKTDKEVYKKLEDDYGETVLYAPKFDMQTAAVWLSPVSLRAFLSIVESLIHIVEVMLKHGVFGQLLVAGAAAGVWAYNKHRQRTNVHIMALNLIRGVPLTPKEKEMMLDILTPPQSTGTLSTWWNRWRGH
ncbi:hypothetical protein HS088_TW12G00359 [Tripterygium wilfordii]|uniref:Cytochrome c-type biogenesis protein n=1 Tax=Tripterygium wilfordii TaxID=458696 RepID=A0A7J7CYX5_TRIWF|nr:hypothetical protein HS088_TW12G00359 [Tripterygium wilfordii]